jgi:hypothetical protein
MASSSVTSIDAQQISSSFENITECLTASKEPAARPLALPRRRHCDSESISWWIGRYFHPSPTSACRLRSAPPDC